MHGSAEVTRPFFATEGDRAVVVAGDQAAVVEESAVLLDINSLTLDGSARLAGESREHTRVLAEASTSLPPVLVHRTTMRVIDGTHRLQAARLRGERKIRAVFFEGDDDAAFVEAVRANIAHGLPLTLADRRAAAERILRSHGHWSDRAIAKVTGLAAATVRSIRRRVIAQTEQLPARLGSDGKLRPLDPVAGRRRAAQVVAERPEASLREIAGAAGISTRTARDVRMRVQDGEDPVPASGRRSGRLSGRAARSEPKVPNHRNGRHRDHVRVAQGTRDTSSLLEGLRRDPSLRYSEVGRRLVRWLDTHLVEPAERSQLAEAVPPHCSYIVVELANRYADAWRRIADSFTRRTEEPASGPTRM